MRANIVSIPLLSGPVLNEAATMIIAPPRRLNPFAFRASAELSRECGIAALRCLNPFAFRASAEPKSDASSRTKRVSIPLLSGPVLNKDADGVPHWGLGLNPFAFRASAERRSAMHRTSGGGLNPFAFRASAERSWPAPAVRRSTVSIPLLSGPVLNRDASDPNRDRSRSQSLCFQGQC